MILRYTNTVEDMVAFNRFHVSQSPTARRGQLIGTGCAICIIMAITTAVALAVNDLILIAFGVVGAVFAAVIAPSTFKSQIDRQARRMYREGSNKGLLGPHEIELVGSDLVTRSTFGESRVRLAVVERVTEMDGYTFIYLGAIMAVVIPHDAVTFGDPVTFTEELKERVARAQEE